MGTVDGSVGEEGDLVGEDEFGDREAVLVGEGEELFRAAEGIGTERLELAMGASGWNSACETMKPPPTE